MALDPNVDPDDKGNGDDPKFVTQEQLAKVVNQAVSSHMGRLETRLTTTLGSSITDALKDIVPKPPGGDDPPLDPPPGGGPPNPEMTSLKRQISTLTNKLSKAEEARADEATQRRSAALKTAVMRELGESGLSGQHLRGARAVLYQDDKVHTDAEGNNLFRNDDGVDVPLADGVKDWIASDDAKLFLPPKDVRGSGDRGSSETKLPKMKDDAMSQAYADAIEGVNKLRLNNQG